MKRGKSFSGRGARCITASLSFAKLIVQWARRPKPRGGNPWAQSPSQNPFHPVMLSEAKHLNRLPAKQILRFAQDDRSKHAGSRIGFVTQSAMLKSFLLDPHLLARLGAAVDRVQQEIGLQGFGHWHH